MDVNQSEQIFSGIIAFLEKLRQRGFAIGVDTHVRVIAVMKHLALQKIDNDTLYEQRLMLSLRALLVCDEVQQEEFAAFFEKNKHLLFEIEKPINTGTTAPEKETKKEPKRIKKRWFVLAGVLLLGIITTIVLLQKQKSDIQEDENRINARARNKVDSLISAEYMACKADALRIAQAKIDSILKEKSVKPKPNTILPPEKDEPYYPQFDSLVTQPLPLPQASETPIKPSWWSLNGRFVLGIAMLVILAAMGLWAFSIWLLSRHYQYAIQSDSGKQPPYFLPLRLKNTPKIAYDVKVPRLHGHEPIGALYLDVQKTVEASVRKAGALQPQYRQQEQTLEYVVLIDVQTPQSHQTALFEHICKTLLEENAPIHRYFFYGDASWVWDNQEHAHGLSLEQLQYIHPHARLLFFATGYSFINPNTGHFNKWVEQLEFWEKRVLLSSTPTQSWSYKEIMLSKFFVVLPAHVDGIARIMEHLEHNVTPNLRQWKYQWEYRQPAIDLYTWDYELEGKEETEITDKDCQRFKTDLLQWYSADLLQWIAACALYPELQWDLTLAICSALSPKNGETLLTMNNLISINRLPWFVQGHIPSKYRILLLGVLEEDKQKAALWVINGLLHDASQGLPTDSTAYQTAQMQLVMNEALLADTRAAQREVLEKYRKLHSEGARANFVSLIKLKAKTPLSRLALLLPQSLSHFLFKNGDGLWGWRKRAPLILLPILILLSLLWYWVPQPVSPYQNIQLPLKKYTQNKKTHIEFYLIFDCYKNSNLTVSSERLLDSIWNTLEIYKIDTINVIGYATDNSLCANQTLPEIYKSVKSSEFAQIVCEKIIKKGISSNKIQKKFHGSKIDGRHSQSLPIGVVVDLSFINDDDTLLDANMMETFEMIFVAGGTFVMGCKESASCNDDEIPAHKVTIDDFYISKYEVTKKQWRAVMGNTRWTIDCGENCPIGNVSWDDAQNFIEKLNHYTGKKYRLPTEAEWEYAARGGIKSKNYKYSGSNDIEQIADFNRVIPQPVGNKKANELGIYDMPSNILEWCSDWYDRYNAFPKTNPKGGKGKEFKVLRGGYWITLDTKQLRPFYRSRSVPNKRDSNFGFRLVLESY